MANRQDKLPVELRLLHSGGSADQVETLLDQLEPGDMLHAVFNLKADEQRASPATKA